MLPLSDFGRRIMICGPSSSGKSTLAAAIGRKLGAPAVHLDLFRHLPNTDWVQRPDADFHRLHDEAIRGDTWVMDGNYSRLMPQRFQRANGVILIGGNRWMSLARYFRRTLFERQRAGNLEGTQDSIKWDMVHWILVELPKNLRRYRIDLPATGLPFVEISSMRALRRAYVDWGLSRE